MEKIVVSQLFLASEEEVPLWELPYSIHTIFPENTKQQNLNIAQEAIIWMYDTGKIDFTSDNKELNSLFLNDKLFLHHLENWTPNISYSYDDALLVMITDKGNAYYEEFRKKFIQSIVEHGLIRRGKKYRLSPNIITLFKKIKTHFFVSNLVRTLGIPPITLDENFVQHTDDLTRTRCVVDTRTDTIIDISHVKN